MWYGMPCSRAQEPLGSRFSPGSWVGATLFYLEVCYFFSAGSLLSYPPGPTEALTLFQELNTASGPPLRPRSLVASSSLYLNG